MNQTPDLESKRWIVTCQETSGDHLRPGSGVAVSTIRKRRVKLEIPAFEITSCIADFDHLLGTSPLDSFAKLLGKHQ